MKKLVAACAFGLAVSSAFAAKTNTWTSVVTAGHWADAASWGGELPAAGDFVKIPSGQTAYLNDADIAFINTLSGLIYASSSSTVDFTVEGDATVTCTINGTGIAEYTPNISCPAGTLVKNGAGKLFLSRTGMWGYKASFTVNAGILQLPVDEKSASNYQFNKVVVAKGAQFWTTSGIARIRTWFMAGLYGEGIVTNPGVNEVYLYFGGSSDPLPDFHGQICGKFSFHVDGTGSQGFYGVNQLSSSVEMGSSSSTYGLESIGGIYNSHTNVGSQGTGAINFNGNGTVRYLGAGEVSYGTFAAYDTYSQGAIDGGANGGLRLSGNIALKGAKQVKRFVLTGSHTNECTLECAMSHTSPGSLYITKKGTGTWHFKDNAERKNEGVLAVEEGTVRFESIHQAGVVTSLGLSSSLTACYTGAYSAESNVPYAFLLGNGTTSKVGTMEYTGSGAACCENRPFAVKGAGRVVSSGGALRLSGVSALTDGSVLTLGGSAAGCAFDNVTDGAGSLKIVKEGAGDWTLGGNLDFSGGVEVKEGVLAFAGAPVPANRYTYYRFGMLAKNKGGSGSAFFDLGRFGLFNAAGAVQNANLTYNAAAVDDPVKLLPGEYSFTMEKTGSRIYKGAADLFAKSGYPIESLFLYSEDGTDFMRLTHKGIDGYSSGWPGLTCEYASSPYLILRLPRGAEAVTSYDVGSRWASQTVLDKGSTARIRWMDTLGTWTVEASEDGVRWDMLSGVTNNWERGVTSSDNAWLSDGSLYTTAAGWQSHTTGWAIPSATMRSVADPVNDLLTKGLPCVKISAGATLKTSLPIEIKSFAFDETAGGTIDGFAFAEGGTIAVTGAAAKLASVKIPLAFANATNLANVNGWTVSYNGKPVRTVRVYATADGLELAKTGLCVIVK